MDSLVVLDSGYWAVVLENPFSLAITVLPSGLRSQLSQTIESIRNNNFSIMNAIFLPVPVHSPQKNQIMFKV